MPWPPNHEPRDSPAEEAHVEAIAAAARNLVQLRDRWLNPPDIPEADLKKRTLTILYNTRPAWLADAHRPLDAAVLTAYGWPSDLTTAEILAPPPRPEPPARRHPIPPLDTSAPRRRSTPSMPHPNPARLKSLL